jgi:hypothetical protein
MYEAVAGTNTWDFCGVSGLLHEELQFEMVKGKCVPTQKFTAKQYCDGIVSLGIYVGSFVLSNVKGSDLTEYDTKLLEHIIVSGVGITSATVVVTGTSYVNHVLTVQFMLSAVMEDSNMHGVFSDVLETFSDTVINNIQNAANQGYFMTVLREDVTLHVISENDVLSTTSSFDFVSMEFVRVEYRDKLTSQAIAPVMLTEEHEDVVVWSQSNIGLMSSIACMVLVLTLFGIRSVSSKSKSNNHQLDECDTLVEETEEESSKNLFDLSNHSDVDRLVDDLDLIDASQRPMVRRK